VSSARAADDAPVSVSRGGESIGCEREAHASDREKERACVCV
jgi:hypothetical protein